MTQTPDDHAPATRKRFSIFNPSTPLWLFPALTVILCALIIWIPTRPRTADDLSKKQLARDAAARARAGAFVQALGFEPGPAVCRARGESRPNVFALVQLAPSHLHRTSGEGVVPCATPATS